MVSIQPISGLDMIVLLASLGAAGGVITNYLVYLWMLIPGLGSMTWLTRLVAILTSALVGWVICILVFGPGGPFIVCIVIIVWSIISAQIFRQMDMPLPGPQSKKQQ